DGPRTAGGDAVAREQHVLDLRAVDDQHDHCVANSCERSRGIVAPRAVPGRFLLRFGSDVADVGGKAAAQQAAHDAHAHGAGADDADVHRYFAGGGSTAYGSQSRSGADWPSAMKVSSVPRPRSSIDPLL